MADSFAGSYAQLAGVEIVNDARTLEYLRNGLRPPTLNIRADACGCDNIRELVGCDPPYTNPADDNAPWFSPEIPESAEFAGFLVTEFDGVGSTWKRSVSERITDGGVLGRGRLESRTLSWTGVLLGSTCCGVAYGLRWLSQQLANAGSCRDCNGDDLILLYCCPSVTGVEPFRLLKNVGLTEGPNVVNQRILGSCSSGCSGSCVTEIEFSLVSAQPYLYAEPVPVYDCIPFTDAINTVTDNQGDCETNCGDFILTSLCPPPVLPPTATYTNSCEQNLSPSKSLYLTVPRNHWDFLEEVVPVISITTGLAPPTDIHISFYISANGDPCGELITFPPTCLVMCDELSILGIPPESTFYIDGRVNKMALICGPTSIFPGEPLTLGPWSWPSFRELGFCMEVKFPDPVTHLSVDGVCVSLSLVPRTF